MASAPTTDQSNQAPASPSARGGADRCAGRSRAARPRRRPRRSGKRGGGTVAADEPGRRRCRCCRRAAARSPPALAGQRFEDRALQDGAAPAGGSGDTAPASGIDAERAVPTPGRVPRPCGPGRSRRRAPGPRGRPAGAAPRPSADRATGQDRVAACDRPRPAGPPDRRPPVPSRRLVAQPGCHHATIDPRVTEYGIQSRPGRDRRRPADWDQPGDHLEVVDRVDVTARWRRDRRRDRAARRRSALGAGGRRRAHRHAAEHGLGSVPGSPMTHQPPSVGGPEHGLRPAVQRRSLRRSVLSRPSSSHGLTCGVSMPICSPQPPVRARVSAQALASRSARSPPR